MLTSFQRQAISCSIENCDRPLLAKGLCNAHYLRAKKGKPLDTAINVRREKCSVCDGKHYGQGFCQKHYNRAMRQQRWETLVKLHGGCCDSCKVTYPVAVYDFHHLNPEEKEFSIGNEIVNRTLDELIAEASKCRLLCANCHRVEHAN